MPSLRDLSVAWNLRPPSYSRRVWALVVALDTLPWPWGEKILAGCFVASGLLRTAKLRQALAWARAQPGAPRRRWRLAGSLCAHQGGFVARSALVGLRTPEMLERVVAVRGAEHLAAAGGGAILLGFHLGPRSSHVALRVAGHRVTWVGGAHAVTLGSHAIQERYQRRDDLYFSETLGDGDPGAARSLLGPLYAARRLLLGGGSVFITADGIGREAFSVSVPGGWIRIREGWLALRQATSAPVLPVLAHMQGRTQVVTIHPPLPSLGAGPVRDVEACRRALGDLLSAYVRRFPEQCCSVAFPPR